MIRYCRTPNGVAILSWSSYCASAAVDAIATASATPMDSSLNPCMLAPSFFEQITWFETTARLAADAANHTVRRGVRFRPRNSGVIIDNAHNSAEDRSISGV